MPSRIVVTGAAGFLGRHIIPVLQKHYGAGSVLGVTRRDYDLQDAAAVSRMFADHRPEIVVHLGAYSGGIGANLSRPADFYYRNTLLQALVFEAAARHGVKKLVYPIGGCGYPARAASPIGEEQMWEGLPQSESLAYSSAKKMGLVAARAYRAQYGMSVSVVVPGNVYGDHDNFRRDESHVIAATVRRIFEAHRAGDPSVKMWGSGRPVRDFVYAGDVAALIPFFIDHYDSPEPVNLSTGTATSIREMAEAVCRVVGYRGELTFDTSRPDGQMVKVFDVSRLKGLGLSCPTPLLEGLRRTVAWLAANYDGARDGLRL